MKYRIIETEFPSGGTKRFWPEYRTWFPAWRMLQSKETGAWICLSKEEAVARIQHHIASRDYSVQFVFGKDNPIIHPYP